MILQEINNKDEKNIRLDLFLIKYIKDISRNKIQKLINNGFVKVDDFIVKPSFKLKGNENIIIEENRFGFEPEITAKVAKLKCRIFEVGISYNGRTYEQGKKIGWKDGFSAIRCIIKYNLFRK